MMQGTMPATPASARPPTWDELRDMTLAEALRDRLAHDDRTARLELAITVDGGVAHVRGQTATEDERQFVRGLLRQQAGLYAVWDLLALPGQGLAVADMQPRKDGTAPPRAAIARWFY